MTSRFKVLRRAAASMAALAVLTVTWMAAIAPVSASASSAANTALIDGESVTTFDGIKRGEEPISLEQYAAENAGYAVTVKTGAEWDAMTAEEFAKYQVLIVGDPICSETAPSAVSNAATWTPVVMGKAGGSSTAGNRTLVGTDPEYHYLHGGGGAQPKEAGNPASAGAEHLVQDGITYAGGVAGATGVYFDTSCSDLEEPAVSRVAKTDARSSLTQEEIEGPDGLDKTAVLDHLTESTEAEPWTENVEPPCGGSVQQIAENPAFDSGPTKLEDSDIQGWSCSDHITFPAFPTDWHALAVATDTSTTPTCGIDPRTEELACGQAYVLVAGRGIVAKSELALTPPSGSDEAGSEHTHTVTATLTKKKTEPVPNTAVSFIVTGQNAGVTGTCTTTGGAADPECKTDETGAVRFTYKDANGAGEDTINASATVEHTVEEPVLTSAATIVKTTEQATATETWTPAKPAVVVTPAVKSVTAVLGSKEVVPAKGTAHTSRVRSCIASSGYTASVHGSSIASVTFTLDGHRVKTLTKPTSAGTFAVRLNLRSGRAHHLAMHVVFTASSKTPATTLHKTLARCAAVRRVLPTFTG